MYPKAKVILSSVDQENQVSLTVTRQLSLGRILAAKTLLKKFDYKAKDILLRLNDKPTIPDEIDSEYGLIVVQIK